MVGYHRRPSDDRFNRHFLVLRRAAKRDAAECEVVKALTAVGFHVERLSAKGVPDLLLSRAGRWYVAEIKTGKGSETLAQVDFRKNAKAPIPILRTWSEAVKWANGLLTK